MMWSTAKQFMWMHSPATLEFRGDRLWSICANLLSSNCLPTGPSFCLFVYCHCQSLSHTIWVFVFLCMSFSLCLYLCLSIVCVSVCLSRSLSVPMSLFPLCSSLSLPFSQCPSPYPVPFCSSLSTTSVIPVFRKAHLEQSKLKQSLPTISHPQMQKPSLQSVNSFVYARAWHSAWPADQRPTSILHLKQRHRPLIT